MQGWEEGRGREGQEEGQGPVQGRGHRPPAEACGWPGDKKPQRKRRQLELATRDLKELGKKVNG